MPQKITDENGDEIEVFTAEELNAQKEEAIEKYKEENPDKTEELTKIQEEMSAKDKELEELKKQIEGISDKDRNFAALRKKVQDKEKEVEDLKGTIDEKIGAVKKEVLDTVMKDHYESEINRLAGDDKELKDKIELQYKRLTDTAGTKDEISKKLNDAFILATGKTKESFDSSAFSSGGVSGSGVKDAIKGAKEKLSNEEKELLQKMGEAGGIKFTKEDLEGK